MVNRLLRYQTTSYQFKKGILRSVPGLRSNEYNLTLSHSHKFLWFRVSKVGTRTILHELKKNDVVFEKTHQRLIAYDSFAYPDYYKFAFVRNPWSRLVSAWKNKIVDSNAFQLDSDLIARLQSFTTFVDYIEKLDLSKSDIHVRPQTYAIDMRNIDFIGRFEDYEEHLGHVFDRLGVPLKEISRKNNSNNDNTNYREYYTDDLAELVGRLYSSDVEQFNYEF